MAVRSGWMPGFLRRLSQSASNLLSCQFSSSWVNSDIMWGSSIFNTYYLKNLASEGSVGTKMALNIIDLAWVLIRTHSRNFRRFLLWTPQYPPQGMCLLQSTPYVCAALPPYQPEKPGPTQPRRKGQQWHLFERTVKKHHGSIQSFLSGISCTKPEFTFQSVRAIFFLSWQLKLI